MILLLLHIHQLCRPQVARQVFRNLEAFKEKVLRGSLQTKDCKLHFNSLSPDADKDVAAGFDTNKAALTACKQLLLELESSIEARYMKPPLKSHHPGQAPNIDEEVRTNDLDLGFI